MLRYLFLFSFCCLFLSNGFAQTNLTPMPSSPEKTIDDFAKASVSNLSFQNGINVFIETPESDEDALYQGFRIAHTNREFNGGWKILFAKDIIIKDIEPLHFRAVLYSYNNKEYIVLYKKEAENKYYFRIFNARYSV